MGGSVVSTDGLIYKILGWLERTMDEDKPNYREIQHKALGITENRWKHIMLMLMEEGLVEGVSEIEDGNSRLPIIFVDNVRITLRGIRYLAENSATARIIEAAKLLKDVIPGL